MKKMLTSKWFAAILGMAAFLATIVVLWKPASGSPGKGLSAAGGTNDSSGMVSTNQPSPPEETVSKPIVHAPQVGPTVGQAGEAGTLNFSNPEMVQLRIELQQEKSALMEKERMLRDLERQLKLEKAEIGLITNAMGQAKASLEQALTKERTIVQSSETNQLRQLANVFTNMVPENAVSILNAMPVDEIARILFVMPYKQQADILENFATNKLTKDLGRATEISEKIRTLAPKPQLPMKR